MADLLRTLDPSCLAQLVELLEDADFIYVVMPLYGEELIARINRKGRFTEGEARSVIKDVLLGVAVSSIPFSSTSIILRRYKLRQFPPQ